MTVSCSKRTFFFKDFIYLFLDGKRREKERERNINVWLPLACPLLGTWLSTEAGALAGNQTGDPLVQAGAQSAEPHQPGKTTVLNMLKELKKNIKK